MIRALRIATLFSLGLLVACGDGLGPGVIEMSPIEIVEENHAIFEVPAVVTAREPFTVRFSVYLACGETYFDTDVWAAGPLIGLRPLTHQRTTGNCHDRGPARRIREMTLRFQQPGAGRISLTGMSEVTRDTVHFERSVIVR